MSRRVEESFVSYDLLLLDDRGAPSQCAPIGVDDHWHLICLAMAMCYPPLLRMEDYYADAQYEPDEIASLIRELTMALADLDPREAGVRGFLTKAVALAVESQRLEKGLACVSD